MLLYDFECNPSQINCFSQLMMEFFIDEIFPNQDWSFAIFQTSETKQTTNKYIHTQTDTRKTQKKREIFKNTYIS